MMEKFTYIDSAVTNINDIGEEGLSRLIELIMDYKRNSSPGFLPRRQNFYYIRR